MDKWDWLQYKDGGTDLALGFSPVIKPSSPSPSLTHIFYVIVKTTKHNYFSHENCWMRKYFVYLLKLNILTFIILTSW